MPVPEQDVELVTPTISENSTVTEDHRREIESQKTPRYVRLNHSEDQIIGDKSKGVMRRRRLQAKEVCLISQIKPTSVVEECKMNVG